MAKITHMLGIEHRLFPVHDGRYGNKRSDGTWNGIIGEVMRKQADIGAAPIYITKRRQEVVDFTRPFQRVQATILIKRPTSGDPFPVHTVSDLLSRSTMSIGTLRKGVIRHALQRSNVTMYKELLRRMVLTDSNLAGIAKVRRGGFAFVLPTNIAEYVSNMHPCDLTLRGRFLVDSGFGLAVLKGSSLLEKLNKALEVLERTGYLDRLYTKWWHTEVDCRPLVSGKLYRPRAAERNSATRQFRLLASSYLFAATLCIFNMSAKVQ
ncbi:hypothetical protein NP493_301g00000 [Ridgeia piscesae]|uniref:Ionotropic glutamate receptor C-terminal domain-containing protein n=1 Tax=Ridgeia piscesae TaxID=27915 RepID=A0AAD9NW66_RIDPI|nr:hypothetical protein NP493_301g00000 [Ridgeia piscesae]